MDVFYPFVLRPLLPGEPRRQLIGPVTKYTRIMPVHPNREYQSSWQVVLAARDARQHDNAAKHTQSDQPELLQTSHPETPAAEQHADAEGHLDLYI
jgi:hypothetical protein